MLAYAARPLCNLYSIRKGRAAILDLARAMRNDAGCMEPGSIWPDYTAPIVRTDTKGDRTLTSVRWEMPSPAISLEGNKMDKGVTNIRNTRSPPWRRWPKPENRCLAPLTSFSEPGRDATANMSPICFRLNGGDLEPEAFFAGI